MGIVSQYCAFESCKILSQNFKDLDFEWVQDGKTLARAFLELTKLSEIEKIIKQVLLGQKFSNFMEMLLGQILMFGEISLPLS